jgi:hypothetical protein
MLDLRFTGQARVEIMKFLVKETIGDLKNVVALMLLLNRPHLTEYRQSVPRALGWIGNKRKPLLDHTVVTIPIDARPVIRSIGQPGVGEGPLRRRHRVRGTWCHNEEAREYAAIAGCIHEWQPDTAWRDDDPDDPDHYKCEVCGGKRWWRVEHKRGSEALGQTDSEYQVTA